MQFRYTNILYLDRDTGARFSGHFLFEVLGGQESQRGFKTTGLKPGT